MDQDPAVKAVATPGRPEVDGRPTPRELLVWGVLVIVMLTLIGLSAWRRTMSTVPPPQRLGSVPEFSLLNRDGATVGSGELRGTPWVADFFFTRCVGICPRLTSQMRRLEQRLRRRPDVRFVSFTVDPEADTPERLQAYAEGFGAPDRWLFLTGAPDAIYDLVRNGFRLAIDPEPEPGGGALPGEDILHSNRFVLVDADGTIRGYYDAFDEAALDRLVTDLDAL